MPGRRVLRNLFLQAAAGTVLYNVALLAGLRLTTALEGGLVLATLPAVIALGSALWLGERIAPRGWAAVALAAGGMGASSSPAAAGPAAAPSATGWSSSASAARPPTSSSPSALRAPCRC